VKFFFNITIKKRKNNVKILNSCKVLTVVTIKIMAFEDMAQDSMTAMCHCSRGACYLCRLVRSCFFRIGC
jgi:hypothetical protein